VGTFWWEELGGDSVSRKCIRSSREREMDGWRETTDLLNNHLRHKHEFFGDATIVDITDKGNENERSRLNWRRIM
jgi:hypothetical protein